MQRDLKTRTKAFALAVLALAREIPKDSSGVALVGQLVRAGTGVAANYRAACRATSRADFISKLTTAEEEADESSFWLEVLSESGIIPARRIEPLLDEAGQLTAIIVASAKTAKANRR